MQIVNGQKKRTVVIQNRVILKESPKSWLKLRKVMDFDRIKQEDEC